MTRLIDFDDIEPRPDPRDVPTVNAWGASGASGVSESSGRLPRRQVSPLPETSVSNQPMKASGHSLADSNVPNICRSFGCYVDLSASAGPVHERMLRRMYLRAFLRKHGFKNEHTVRQGGCFSRREAVYPIHVAVMEGDLEIVKMLLEAGVDIEKESSTGRDAIDFAQQANANGSHSAILSALREHVLRSLRSR